ncbi:nicotinate-nucleotide adenylyltransferase [Lysinibacillus sp. 2017]|uniref:nicotinate-nucleotide adenylyltransferase n=1 Tax=unclassified Lysinibacillus TaxID=2636778 RepID=UPI000D527CA1|nr:MULTISPECIES: nicotinate-nucleotide adenylyltransferase [unclassified Lysinibacillus]AWE08120.1 nicotinate-nucleotide adenylyltransferase [Lysinibacillus sp. 2017]TGN36376.1 nicotinate-nucleotide adenylyltransferase [Lysinibacillus sp. S2017]
MKKVGLFGGTFNPVHIGHLIMANEVYAALDLAEVRFMPNATAPHKETSASATNEQRLQMVELAIEGISYFKVERFEMERGGVSYTYDTMKAMREHEPDVEFYFIIGGDMIDSLHTWYRIDELMELVHFVGVKRPGSKAKTSYNVQMVEAPEINLSSTFIRKRLQQTGPLQFLLPLTVESYIRKEGLYGATKITRGH